MLCFPAARRTPPVDFVHRALAAKWTRENPPAPPGPPLGTSSRAHASQTLPRAATPPPPCAAPLLAPTARRRAPRTQIDRPQTLLPSPRSSLAYKNPQSSTVARLLLLLPPPAAPPWPARSSSRGPATPAHHCSIRPPHKLLHLPVELHARGIKPNPFSDAVPLPRHRRRARAHRGPVSPEGD